MENPSKSDVLTMFLDRTAGESTKCNRLVTRATDSGNVELVAYGWLKVAEYNESRGAVTIFSGHKSLRSTTVSGYLNDVARLAEERGRDVVLSGESPTVGKPNDGTRFIGNYISMSGNDSAVEAEARQTVIDSLKNVA